MPAHEMQKFTELDFELLKDDLKKYVKEHPSGEFTDFNFEGSNLNFLLDVLTYNTQLNAFYANMTYGENFIATAQRRKSLVSLARNIGYIPRPRKPSMASVKIEFKPNVGTISEDALVMTVPKGISFSGKNTQNKTFTFYTTESKTILRGSVNDPFIAKFEIYEGKPQTFTDIIGPGENSIILQPKGIDYTLLEVKVKQSPDNLADDNYVPYTRTPDYTQITNKNSVYWVEEIEGERYRIYFGDDRVGVNLKEGWQVKVDYFINAGPEANNIKRFTIDTLPKTSNFNTNWTAKIISVEQQSSGGAPIESMDSIRHYAPLFYKAQNRVVTYEDYEAIIHKEFGIVEDVICWGGEEDDPPAYGFVNVCIKPRGLGFLYDTQKTQIINFLKQNYSVLSIDPVIVPPEYMFLSVESTVTYDSNIDNPGPDQLQTSIVNAIEKFSETELDKFGSALRMSKFLLAVDNVSKSILTHDTKFLMTRKPSTIQEVVEQGVIDFYNEIVPGTVRSNYFAYGPYQRVRIEDNAEDGRVYGYYYDTFKRLPLIGLDGIHISVGSMNYTKGRMSLELTPTDFSIASFGIEEGFLVTAEPENLDIVSGNQSMVMAIDPNEVIVNVIDVTTGIEAG